MSSRSFKLLGHKQCSHDASLMSWSSNMDLLATVSPAPDVQLIVYRLTWQKLFQVRIGSNECTALCWHAEGKCLALGDSQGSLFLVDVESGEVVFNGGSCIADRIACFQWVLSSHKTASRYASPFAPLLPAISPVPPVSSFPNPSPQRLVSTSQSNPSPFSMLVVSGGTCVTFRANGVFPIGRIQLAGGESIESACVCPQLDTAALLVRRNTPLGHQWLLQIWDVNRFVNRADELQRLVADASEVTELIAAMHNCVRTSETIWKDGVKPLYAKLLLLDELVQESNGIGTAKETLLQYLIGSTVSSSLSRFLSQSLSEQALNRIEKSVESACISLSQVFQQHLIPTVERLLLIVTDLQGLAQWQERFKKVGLQPNQLSALVEPLKLFLRTCEELLRCLTTVRSIYKSVTVWFHHALWSQTQETSPSPSRDVNPPTASDLSRISSWLQSEQPLIDDEVTRLLNRAISESVTLPVILNDIDSCWRIIAESPAESISESFEMVREVSLHSGPAESTCWSIHWLQGSGNDVQQRSQLLVTLCLKDTVGDRLCLLQHTGRLEEEEGSTQACMVRFSSDTVLESIQRYNDTSIGCLTTTNSGAKLTLFDWSELPFQPFHEPLVSLQPIDVASVDNLTRQRTFDRGGAKGLALTGTRRLAAIWFSSRVVSLLDMEEDEEEDAMDPDVTDL